MKVKIAEMKAKLSAYIARVDAGEDIEITNHGRTVARLVSQDERLRTIAPRSTTAVGRIKISHYQHGVENIDDLLQERQKERQ